MGKKVYTALNIYAFDEDYPKIKEQAKLLNDTFFGDSIEESSVFLKTVGFDQLFYLLSS